jgi:hypothetical protein
MHKFSVLNRALAVQQMIERGIEVSPLGSYGAWRKQGINVLKGEKGIALWMPVTIKDKTLIHEMAHQIMHADTIWHEQPPAVLEVEAESVAFIVCATLGLADDDALSSSRAYIQGWASSFPGWKEKVPTFHAKRIFNAANRIIKSGEEFSE